MRNKFKDAYNQGYRKARFFLEQVAKLYKHEDGYRRDNLLATGTRKNVMIFVLMESLMPYVMDCRIWLHCSKRRGDLMQTTLNYLHKFWDRLFAYRKDGEYTIGNLADGRAIRP